MFLTPADPSFSSGWLCRDWSLAVIGPNLSVLLPGEDFSPDFIEMKWSGLFSREWSRSLSPLCFFCFAADGRPSCFGGKQRVMVGVCRATSRTFVGTFHEFGYFETCFHETSISCYGGKIDKLCVGISNSMCHIRCWVCGWLHDSRSLDCKVYFQSSFYLQG